MRPAVWLLATLLAACTNPIQMHKAGATPAEYERDRKICESQAERARTRNKLAGQSAASAHNRVLLACMHERGWEQAPQ